MGCLIWLFSIIIDTYPLQYKTKYTKRELWFDLPFLCGYLVVLNWNIDTSEYRDSKFQICYTLYFLNCVLFRRRASRGAHARNFVYFAPNPFCDVETKYYIWLCRHPWTKTFPWISDRCYSVCSGQPRLDGETLGPIFSFHYKCVERPVTSVFHFVHELYQVSKVPRVFEMTHLAVVPLQMRYFVV